MRLGKKAGSEFTSRIRRIVALHKTSWLLATTLPGLACVTSVLAADELYVNPPVAMELTAVPDVPEELTTNVSRYQNVRSASVVNWIGDSLLIMTRFGDTRQLHLVNSPLGMREQITFADEPIGGALIPPLSEPDLLIYSKDVGGSESYQLFQMELVSRTSELLTDGKSRYTGVSFNPSGTKIAYSSTELNGRDTDLFVQDLGGERIVVQQGEGVGWSVEDWSPDEQRILISRYVSVVESELYEVDLSTLERTRLLAEHGAISIGSVAYSGSGEHAYFTSYLDGEYARIFELDLKSGAVGPRSPKIDWNVSFFRLSRDRTVLAYVVNEGGYSKTYLVNLANGQELALPEFPLGHMSNIRFNHDGSRMAFSYQTATTQTDVHVLDLETQTVTRWTKSELGELPAQSMVSPELKQYSSFDGRQIPVFVYKPKSEGPHPVLIYIHGGPESQYRPRFSATFQFYVNELGISLLVPNVRGSSGYGKTYLGLDNGYLREDSVRDIGALLDFIATDDTMDSSRVGVIGGSYGGYMVLASLVHFNDRLKAGVETVGISNFVTFLENTQDYRRDLRRAEYGDERIPEMRAFLESIAPLNQVERISTPLLIGQGLNDPRVPASESRQIVDALQSRDIPVWYVLAKDEGHGFRKKPNRDYWWYVVTLFLSEHLL